MAERGDYTGWLLEKAKAVHAAELAARRGRIGMSTREVVITRRMRWFPVLTFWQLTADILVSGKPPPGHGHRYGPEVPTAWAAILHPPTGATPRPPR